MQSEVIACFSNRLRGSIAQTLQLLCWELEALPLYIHLSQVHALILLDSHLVFRALFDLVIRIATDSNLLQDCAHARPKLGRHMGAGARIRDMWLDPVGERFWRQTPTLVVVLFMEEMIRCYCSISS